MNCKFQNCNINLTVINVAEYPIRLRGGKFVNDVSAHRHGINYQGIWTVEVSGWSEHFLKYIAEIEVAAN